MKESNMVSHLMRNEETVTAELKERLDKKEQVKFAMVKGTDGLVHKVEFGEEFWKHVDADGVYRRDGITVDSEQVASLKNGGFKMNRAQRRQAEARMRKAGR